MYLFAFVLNSYIFYTAGFFMSVLQLLVYLSVYRLIYFYSSVCWETRQFVLLTVCLFVCLSVYSFVGLFIAM